MSIVVTTLTGDVATNDVVINVTSATGTAKRKLIQIDNEFLVETSDVVSGTTAIPVRRGDQGTYAQVHKNGAEVLIGDPSDFEAAPPGTPITVPPAPPWNVVTLVAATAIPVPSTHQNLYVELAGTGANVYTLAVPTGAQDGQELLIQAIAAQAYVVQAPLDPALPFNGVDLDKGTFGGAIGDYIHLKANAALATWMVLDKTNVTLSDT